MEKKTNIVLTINTQGLDIFGDGSIIVFDKKKDAWRVTSKALFLSEQDDKISELEGQVKALTEQVQKAQEKIIEMATILKGVIK